MPKNDKVASKKDTKKSQSETSEEPKKKNDTAIIYRYNKINFSNVVLSDLNKSEPQDLAYISYDDPDVNTETKILLQSDKIRITSGGIPKPHPSFYPTALSREFIKVPLDDKQESCKKLRTHMEAADEFFGSEETKKKIFGSKAKRYEYQPLIKVPQAPVEDSGSEEDKPKKGKPTKGKANSTPIEKLDCIKMKFNFINNDSGDRINKTKLTRINNGKKTKVDATTIDDILREIPFRSEIKFIFYYSKVWAAKTPARGSKMLQYGVGLKVMAIEYTPSAGKGFNVDELTFSSGDSDADSKDAKDAKPTKKGAKLDSDSEGDDSASTKKPTKKSESKKSKNDSEDDSDKDSEKTPVKSSKKGKKNQDSNEDDDDIPVNKKKPEKKSSKKNQDSDEEDDPPKKKSKKTQDDDDDPPKKKSSKKAQNDDEDDVESDVNLKKKSSKGKSASRTK